jgi:hypothetical protein
LAARTTRDNFWIAYALPAKKNPALGFVSQGQGDKMLGPGRSNERGALSLSGAFSSTSDSTRIAEGS